MRQRKARACELFGRQPRSKVSRSSSLSTTGSSTDLRICPPIVAYDEESEPDCENSSEYGYF